MFKARSPSCLFKSASAWMRSSTLVLLLCTLSHQTFAESTSWSEFMGGQRTSYTTEGNPKAKGVEVTFEYPSSWGGADGKRPNMLYQVTSEHGKGLDLCNIGIKDIPIEPGQKISKADIEKLFDPSGLSSFLGGSATLTAGKRTTIDGQPAAQVQFTQDVDRAGMEYRMMGVVFPIYFRNKLITFACMSAGSTATSAEQFKNRYRAVFPLFQQMANTLVIHSRYK